jgi:hypothetical protein
VNGSGKGRFIIYDCVSESPEKFSMLKDYPWKVSIFSSHLVFGFSALSADATDESETVELF